MVLILFIIIKLNTMNPHIRFHRGSSMRDDLRSTRFRRKSGTGAIQDEQREHLMRPRFARWRRRRRRFRSRFPPHVRLANRHAPASATGSPCHHPVFHAIFQGPRPRNRRHHTESCQLFVESATGEI